jgi:hypothetical protein
VSRLPLLMARVCAVALIVAMAREVHLRGSIRHAPLSVISNAYAPLRSAEPFLLFLEQVASRIPPGETVVVLVSDDSPFGSAAPLGPAFLFGVSQLPRQVVLPAQTLSASSTPPQWVASFGTALTDPRYRAGESFRGGILYRAQP